LTQHYIQLHFCTTVRFLPNIEKKLKDVQLTSISECILFRSKCDVFCYESCSFWHVWFIPFKIFCEWF